MKVILTQNVPNLGSLGDEVSVKNGYARNFLLPRGLALAAETRNARAVAHRRRYLERARAEAVAEAQAEAEKVAQVELTVTAKAGPNGRLFGSVTNRDVQQLLAEQGYEVDRKSVTLHEPIRQLGTYAATVKLHTDVKTDIAIHVRSEQAEAEAKAEAEAQAEAAAPAEQEAAAETAAGAGAEAPAEGAPQAETAAPEPVPEEAAGEQEPRA